MAKWMSKLPENCEVCGKKFGVYFYDGSVNNGPWALMCEPCWKKHNGEVGIGIAQKYITATEECIAGSLEEEEG